MRGFVGRFHLMEAQRWFGWRRIQVGFACQFLPRRCQLLGLMIGDTGSIFQQRSQGRREGLSFASQLGPTTSSSESSYAGPPSNLAVVSVTLNMSTGGIKGRCTFNCRPRTVSMLHRPSLPDSQCEKPGYWIHYHVGDFVVEHSDALTKLKFSMTQIDCTHTKGGLCVDSVLIYPSEFREKGKG